MEPFKVAFIDNDRWWAPERDSVKFWGEAEAGRIDFFASAEALADVSHANGSIDGDRAIALFDAHRHRFYAAAHHLASRDDGESKAYLITSEVMQRLNLQS